MKMECLWWPIVEGVCELALSASRMSHPLVDHRPQTSYGAHTHVGAPPQLPRGLR